MKIEAIGTLAGGIAHDFNNILSAIIGYTELSLNDLEKESTLHQNLKEVFIAGGRAKDLVKQILTFSRQAEQELKPVQVKLICKEAVKFLRASLPTSIKIRQEITSDSLMLADPTQIHQVLMNLCTNAGHAMGEKGGVLGVKLGDIKIGADLTVEHPELNPGPYLEVTISDTGRGLSEEARAHLFEVGWAADGQRTKMRLGLLAAHATVARHGGRLDVESVLGEGTTFVFTFPACDAR